MIRVSPLILSDAALRLTHLWRACHAGGASARAAAVVCLLAVAVSAMADDASPTPSTAGGWRVERGDGSTLSGTLAALDTSLVVVTTTDGDRSLPAIDVRVLAPAEMPAVAEMEARLWLTDGSFLTGDNVRLDGSQLTLEQGDNTITLPQRAVAKLAWRLSPAEPSPAGTAPAWQPEVPAAMDSDLIVIRKAAEPEPIYQCVPCAILAIDDVHVTVALDDDQIPVKRERVAGLVWLRGEGAGAVAGPIVNLVGGRLLANEVRYLPDTQRFRVATAWSPELTVPASAVRRIDLAAGRTVSLVMLSPEDVSVEPFFAALAKSGELAAAFEPRMLSGDEAAEQGVRGPMIVALPRTTLRWKLPTGVRQLRMQATVERPQAGGADLVVLVDGEERFRGEVTAEGDAGEAIDVDVSGGRRLELRVDFPAAATGRLAGLGRIRLLDPRLEK